MPPGPDWTNFRPQRGPIRHVDSASEGPGRGRFLLGAIAVFLVGLLVFFIVRPAYVGYATYQDLKRNGVADSYVHDMAQLQKDKELAEGERDAALQRAAAAEADLRGALEKGAAAEERRDACAASLQACTNKADQKLHLETAVVDSFQKDVRGLREELQACTDRIRESDDRQKQVLMDAARRICCVLRVENPAIQGFTTDSGKITCVTSGGENVRCD
jgi:hypothetical protein